MAQYGEKTNEYTKLFSEVFLGPDSYEPLDIKIDDDKLDKMLISSLEKDRDYWNRAPWKLQETDIDNVRFLLGDQLESQPFAKKDNEYIDNRLFSSVRAILSYATGQLAVPEITPSRSDDQYVKMARSIQMALYQHSLDEHVDQKTRSAVLNLVTRKRGFLKLRFDPNAGRYGDIVTDVVNPEDIVISRTAAFMRDPDKIYHRFHLSVDELCARYPKKADAILSALSIRQARWSQVSKFIHPWECWFTYLDNKNIPRQGVSVFLGEQHLILDKMPNPNWVYTGDDDKDKETNVTTVAPKPFIGFNYLNLGHSYIDETCLFEQAKPQQIILNKRGKQFNDNVDFMNGRWIASRKAFQEEDAQKFVNKGARTVALVNAEDVGKAMQVLTPGAYPPQVFESLQDTRSEIDGIMGTPSIFKGSNPQSSDTLGRDQMLKTQAGMLQDDLVRAVSIGMAKYYQLKLQMFRVYYTEDYWFQVKGGDGKFDFVMLNGDSLDSNVKIGVQVDSTLPLDKANIRATALELAKMNRIDQLTLLEDLGLPDPEVRAERYLRSQIDLYTYMQSIEQGMDNNDAEVDIALVMAGKTPQERDVYDQGYLEYFNHFVTQNRFQKLTTENPAAAQRVVQFLQEVQQRAAQTANLQSSMLNDAGIINRPPIFPLPKRTMNIRLQGMMSPQQTQQIAGTEGQMFTPITGAQQAQDPNAQAAAQASQGAATQAQPTQ